MCRSCNNDSPSAEILYETFWKVLVEDDAGQLDQQKVMNELHDYHHVMEEASTVYCHITGDRMSKPLYWAHDVIAAADEELEKYREEAAAEALFDALEATDQDERVVEVVKSLGLTEQVEKIHRDREFYRNYHEQRKD